MARNRLSNSDVADLLDQVGDLLRTQDANPYRVRAYHDAAAIVRAMPRDVTDVLKEGGRAALEKLPGIGRSLAASLDELCHTGRMPILDRLLGLVSPEDLFSTVPGIGEALAHRAHEHLGVETLEELELAAHDGRLDRVPGFGLRRVRMVRESLGEMLRRSSRRRARLIRKRPGEASYAPPLRPSVELLLRVDRRYRHDAAAGRLRTLAPRRFNPRHESWLPILHEECEGWSLTVLFSNTARAHELGRTRDWVILYYERDGHEGQCTVVTETRGPLSGRRVVRGRESESASALRSA